LKTKWGFSYLFFGHVGDNNKWTMATSGAGFNLNKIMIPVTDIPDANRASVIYQYGNAFAYYVGEPADQNHSMGGVRNALNQYGFSSLFIIDGYKRTSELNNCVNLADKVLFSSYIHWWPCFVPPAWCNLPINPDQRYDWTDMKIRYGSKFTMTWIGAHMDYGSYGDLFSCANGLGLDIVWFYQAQDQMDDYTTENIESFCSNAWLHGYLRRFEMEYEVKWKCPGSRCTCDPEYWIIVSSTPTGTIREVFP
jgi:hypothetical protein